MPYLVQLGPNHAVIRTWELRGQPIVFGRGDDVEGKIDDQVMSRKHFTIEEKNGRTVLTDLASTNGTWVNGRRVSDHPLRANDQIRAGQTHFQYQLGTSTMLGMAEGAMGASFKSQLKDIYKRVEE